MTTPDQVEKSLKDCLDQLNAAGLQTFQWLLNKHKHEGLRPIPMYQLENATREETVDKLVQVYGEGGAIEVMADILYRMKHINIVSKFAEAKAGPPVEQQVPEPLSSAARETHSDEESAFSQDLSCALCSCIFTEPVALKCGHSFCRACVHNHWRGESSRKCPLCLQLIDEAELTVNFALKNLSESLMKGEACRNVTSEPQQASSKNVREKQEAFEKVKQFCDSSIEHIKTQSRDTERKIREDFQKLRLFLSREEEDRLVALKEEETQKTRVMQLMTEISRDTFSLSDTVKDMEDLRADNSFIQTFRAEIQRTQNTLPDPRLLPQALINVSKHLENLPFRVWEKMMSVIKHTPVVLDPNTASPWLSLSDDLTKVTVTDTWQQRPGNPECSTNYPQVLACEGFDSGQHCWEVVVGDSTRWILGVAEESIDKKEEMWSIPQKGLCAIMKTKTRYKDVTGNTFTPLTRPNRIRIELDCDNETVSFYDADTNTYILTYNWTITQKLYPYFAFVEIDDDEDDFGDDAEEEDDRSGGFIQICESKVSLTARTKTQDM